MIMKEIFFLHNSHMKRCHISKTGLVDVLLGDVFNDDLCLVHIAIEGSQVERCELIVADHVEGCSSLSQDAEMSCLLSQGLTTQMDRA